MLGVAPTEELTIVDYGDAPVDPLSTERSVHEIRKVVREIAEVKLEGGKHVFPLIIGGDHSLSYPNIAALADVYGKGNVGVIHFDAHYDGSVFFGNLATHGSWVKRLWVEGHVPGRNYIQIGLRGPFLPKLNQLRVDIEPLDAMAPPPISVASPLRQSRCRIWLE